MEEKIKDISKNNANLLNYITVNVSVHHREPKKDEYFIPISHDINSHYIPFIIEKFDYKGLTSSPYYIY